MFSVVFCASSRGQHVAAKHGRVDCLHGYQRAELELIKDAQTASRLGPLPSTLNRILGWSYHAGKVHTIWELIPPTKTFHEAVLERYNSFAAGYLHSSLGQLLQTLIFVTAKAFPLWDAHSCDLFVMAPNGQLTISDWTMGFCPDSGNIGLLPGMLRGPPMQRSAYIAEVGVAKAAHVINTYVLAYYLLMYAWASERQMSRGVMEDAAACRLCLESEHVTRNHNGCVKGLGD